jgi:hypothetical protein
VAAAVNATSTHTHDAAEPSAGGTAKVSTKKSGSSRAPSTMNRRRDPVTASDRSLRAPITGSITTSQIFATATSAPAARAAMPRVSVR